MSKKATKIPTKYDCPYLDCDGSMRMTQCLKKFVEREFLHDAFTEAKFKHAWVAVVADAFCNECKEMTKSHTKKNTEHNVLEKSIRKKMKAKYADPEVLKEKYQQMKKDAIDFYLKDIEKRIEELRSMLHES